MEQVKLEEKITVFLKKCGMENLILAWCDKNYDKINNIDGIPIQAYDSLKNMNSIYIISTTKGIAEIIQILENDNKKYYASLTSWIYDNFSNGEREKLYIEYLKYFNRNFTDNIDCYEGTFRAKLFLTTYSNQSILPANCVIRLGSNYGGWTIPSDFTVDVDDYILCAGAGEDISFDCCMAVEHKCNIVTIDPTPRAIAHYTEFKNAILNNQDFYTHISNEIYKYDIGEEDFKRISYLQFGIADKASVLKFYFPQNAEWVSCSIVNLQNTDKYFEAECLTYPMLLDKLNISGFKLIKLDIEGAEYGVIKSICDSGKLPEVLCVDFDEANHALDIDAVQRIKSTIALLESHGMLPIWIEGDSVTFGLTTEKRL